jgi:ethanolamine utilization protein EutJ
MTIDVKVDLDAYLAQAASVIRWVEDSPPPPLTKVPEGQLHVGVDLGTAYLMLAVLDAKYQPIAGEYMFAEVAKDGLIVDFAGAVDLLSGMKSRVESRLGREITDAASGFPPGVGRSEVSATANVVEATGINCTELIDEPSGANALLQIQNGVIVDVGGGTTGIAIMKNGEVIYTADEPTGGTHFSLVIAGAKDISFEEAEAMKKSPAHQQALFPTVKPVMEKIGNIVSRHIEGYDVNQITLVGGSCAFPGMAKTIHQYTGVPAWVPPTPHFVTPLGFAWHNQENN